MAEQVWGRWGRGGATLGLAWAFALFGAGCDLGAQGAGVLEGASLIVANCHGVGRDATFAPFRLPLTLLSAEGEGSSLTYRLAAAAGLATEVDQLTITVTHRFDLDAALRAAAGGGVTLDVGPDPATQVGVGIALLGRCESATVPLIGVAGTITFERAGLHRGERVRASLSIDVADARSGEVVAEGVRGELDFEVKVGQPFTPFTPRGR